MLEVKNLLRDWGAKALTAKLQSFDCQSRSKVTVFRTSSGRFGNHFTSLFMTLSLCFSHSPAAPGVAFWKIRKACPPLSPWQMFSQRHTDPPVVLSWQEEIQVLTAKWGSFFHGIKPIESGWIKKKQRDPTVPRGSPPSKRHEVTNSRAHSIEMSCRESCLESLAGKLSCPPACPRGPFWPTLSH